MALASVKKNIAVAGWMMDIIKKKGYPCILILTYFNYITIIDSCEHVNVTCNRTTGSCWVTGSHQEIPHGDFAAAAVQAFEMSARQLASEQGLLAMLLLVEQDGRLFSAGLLPAVLNTAAIALLVKRFQDCEEHGPVYPDE